MALNSERLKTLYPFRSRWMDLGGLIMHYIDEGSGDPVVMVHGNPSWSFHFRALIKELRPDHRCIAIDHIGCGLSEKPGDDRYAYTLARRVANLEALLARLRITDNITLVLHDWGGMIGMAYAARHPRRIKRLILFNTAAFPLPPGKNLPTSLKIARTILAGPLLVQGLNAFALGTSWIGCRRRPMSPEIRRFYLAPYDTWENRRATLRFVQDIPLKPSDPAYALVRSTGDALRVFRRTPTAIFWGGQDPVFDADFLSEWRRRLPEARVHEFPDAGHYVLEDAGEEIIPLARRFLADHPVPAG